MVVLCVLLYVLGLQKQTLLCVLGHKTLSLPMYFVLFGCPWWDIFEGFESFLTPTILGRGEASDICSEERVNTLTHLLCQYFCFCTSFYVKICTFVQ